MISQIFNKEVEAVLSNFDGTVSTTDLMLVLISKRILCRDAVEFAKFEFKDYVEHEISERKKGKNKCYSDELTKFLNNTIAFRDRYNCSDECLRVYVTYELVSNKDYTSSNVFKRWCKKNNYIDLVKGLLSRLCDYIGFKTSETLLKYGSYIIDPIEFNTSHDDFYGRDEEISFMFDILCQDKKNNPILVGEAGVGKTSIVYELAYRISINKCPKRLQGYSVYQLDFGKLVAGTKYRGDLEERFTSVLSDIKMNGKIIVFIDEIHTIMNLGTNAETGAIGISDLLKPVMAESDSYFIGATTSIEYKLIEKDSALNRRFSKVYVCEPDLKTTRIMLNSTKDRLEHIHNLHISDEIIDTIVDYSSKFIKEQSFPDKAIDLMMKSFAHCENVGENKNVEIEDVLYVLSKRLNVPLYLINQTNDIDIDSFYNDSSDLIVGQNEQIKSFIQCIKNHIKFRKDYSKPIASFMFIGASGVGKTELCKLFANKFVNDNSFIKLDMTEFQDDMSVSHIIGASAGYVGYNEGSSLIDKVRQNPFSIILFDEIEKANSNVFNLLLQILDDGILTGANGLTANFSNCIIVFTSNVGNTDYIKNKSVGFIDNSNNGEKVYKNALTETFKPEFINRIDRIIYFNEFTKETTKLVVNNEIIELKNHFNKFGINIRLTDNCIEKLNEICYDKIYNARFIKKKIDEHIYSLIINSNSNDIEITYENDEFSINVPEYIDI